MIEFNRNLYRIKIWFRLFLFFMALAAVAKAKDYSFQLVAIDARLSSDGSMAVSEKRSYQFQDSYRYAYREFPKDGPVQFQNFHILEEGQVYEPSDSEQPGTFKIEETSDRTLVTWYFRARNEIRTFEIAYQAANAVVRYEDVAVLYFQFISSEWAKGARNVNVRLQAPTALEPTQINEWLHGPLWAQSRIENDGTIVAWCEQLPKRTYFEIRALYPPEVFSGLTLTAGLRRAQIMAEEAGWAEAANRQRERNRQESTLKLQRNEMAKMLAIIISLIGLMCWWFLFNKFGRRPVLPTQMNLSSEVPEAMPPALLSYLLNDRQIYGTALVSTLFDLARRGILTMHQEETDRRGIFGGSRKIRSYIWSLDRQAWQNADLTDFETSLLDFIFDELAQGQDEIEVKAFSKHQSKFIRFFQNWQKQVKKLGEIQGWYDKASQRGMYYSLALCGILLLFMVGGLLFLGPWSFALGGGAFVILILGFFIPHRTREGEILAQRWRAFKRYLKNYHFREAPLMLDQINDYLIYGLALGLGKKQFENLLTAVPAEQYPSFFPWYVYTGSGNAAFDPGHFTAAFTAMVSHTTSALTSASGTGGGASGGGGGGASSGGGGAG